MSELQTARAAERPCELEWLSWLLGEARRPSPEPGRLAKAEAQAAFDWFSKAVTDLGLPPP